MKALLHVMMQSVPVPARALALFLRQWLVGTLMLASAIVLAIGFSLTGTWLGALADDHLLAGMFQFAAGAIALAGGGVYLTGTGLAVWKIMRTALGKAQRCKDYLNNS